MKILITSETFLPRIGGAEIHVLNLIDNLIKNGHEVVLVTNEPGREDEKLSYKLFRIPWSKKNLFHLLKILWRESGDVDIVHSHYCYRLAMLVGFIALLKRKPQIISLHGLGILNHPGTPFIYQLAHSTYRYLSLQLCTKVISTSLDLAKVSYKYISPKKVVIISNGYNEKLFNKEIQVPPSLRQKYEGQKIIITVRRLVPKNGIHFLIEALPFIVKEIPNIKYIAAGDGQLTPTLKARVTELQLDDKVDFLGAVNNAEIPAYLQLADVVVFPSTAESSSIACAEAMGLGKNIVASRVGGLVELLGSKEERGSLISLVDWEGSNYDAPTSLPQEKYINLANKIIESLKKGPGPEQYAAYRYAQEELTWPVIVNKTIDIYKKYGRR